MSGVSTLPPDAVLRFISGSKHVEREGIDILHRRVQDGKPTCADDTVTDLDRLSALGEEFGEVCRALQEGDRENLREELGHVAIAALAWLGWEQDQ